MTSIEQFGTDAFDLALMRDLIRARPLGEGDGPRDGLTSVEIIEGRDWLEQVPVEYRGEIVELSQSVFSRNRGSKFTRATIESFITDLHREIWSQIEPRGSVPPIPITEIGEAPGLIAALSAIHAIEEFEIIRNVREPGIVRVSILKLKPNREMRDPRITSAVRHVLREQLARSVQLTVSWGPVWMLEPPPESFRIPLELLPDEALA